MNGIGVFHKPPLEIESAKTASFTAEAGYIYPVNLGSVTADLVLTFPSSPATDDRFAVYVSSTHSSGGTSTNFADRPFFCIEPANSTSINGSSYSATAGEGSSEYGLWLAGEYMEYVYDGSTWQVAVDGRIPHVVNTEKSSSQSISNSSVTAITYQTDNIDNADLHSTSTNTERLTIKRSGLYSFAGSVSWDSNSTGVRFVRFGTNLSSQITADRRNAIENSETTIAITWEMSAADYAKMDCKQTSGGSLNLRTGSENNFSVTEIL